MSLLRMSLSGGVMIAVIAVIRAAALHRLPKRAFLVLWEIALGRLLVPYALPSAFSVESLWAKTAPAAATPAPSALIFTAAPVGTAYVPAPGPVWDPWKTVWIAGAAVCAVFFAAAYVKCRLDFRASLPAANDWAARWLGEHPLRRPVSVRQSGLVSAPLTYRVLRPVILLPASTDWNDREALRYVLAHELVHIRRFDAVKKLLFTAALCVHWWNPLVWVMYFLANRDIEISCDEAVVFQFAGGTRAGYAGALLRMEEHKSGFTPLCSNFSRNAIEERIVAIMKMKKTSAAAVITAAALIAATGAAFATTAGTARNGGGEASVQEAAPQVEWWTYDEYKAWLDQEKIELQAMLGERGWTGGRGEFVWTQEVIDETIAMYEQTLEDIQNGFLVSKTVDGSDDIMLMMGSGAVTTASEIPPVEEYAPFGLTLDEAENALYYHGEKVRYFEDSEEVGDGGIAIRCQYYREDGTADLRTVRDRVEYPDGSFDPFGPIVRIESLPAAEAEARIAAYCSVSPEVTCVEMDAAEQAEADQDVLDVYTPFGLEYQSHPVTGQLRMTYRGKPVHSVSDSVTGIWIANNLHGTELGPDAIDLEAVYENGILTGLRESDVPHSVQHPVTEAVAAGGGETSEGTPLPNMFDPYIPFGISYEETAAPDGMERNLYLNGALVNTFCDIKPDGGVFTFGSTRQSEDGLTVYTVYENGILTGVSPS